MTNLNKSDTVRQPSLLDALIPLVFMIVMLIWSVLLFGIGRAAPISIQVAFANIWLFGP